MKKESKATDVEKTAENNLSKQIIIEYLAKYWYEIKYKLLNKTDHKAAAESMAKFNKWLNDNGLSISNSKEGVEKIDIINYTRICEELDKADNQISLLKKEIEELKEINKANISHIEAANEFCMKKDKLLSEAKNIIEKFRKAGVGNSTDFYIQGEAINLTYDFLSSINQ